MELYDVLDDLEASKESLSVHLVKFFEKNTERQSGKAYYDITTYTLESTRWGKMRMFGFSKDHNNNGIPVTYELFPGNTMDLSSRVNDSEVLRFPI